MSLEPWKGQRIGNLRERITLNAIGESPGEDPFGNPLPAEIIEVEVWARVEPLKGREVLEAAQVTASHDLTIHIRHRDDISVMQWITWRGTDYNITSYRNVDERRRYLSIECTGQSD